MDVGALAWTTLVVAVSSIPLALSVWALLDCARRPAWAWGLSGHDRVWWLYGILAGMLCLIGGVFISLWYLLRIRPVVAGVEDGRIPEIS